MANGIVQFDGFPGDILDDLHIDKKGRVFCTTKGAARLYGVSPAAVRKARKGGNLTGVGTSETVDGSEFLGGNLIGEVEFMNGLEYYAYDAGRYCTEQAKRVHRLIGRIGWRSMGQKLTGWQPPSAVDSFIDSHILRTPRTWEVVFDRQWITAAEQGTGWSWGDPCMRHLINLLVYDRLPIEVREKLDELNPVQANGHRNKKQHQFFSVESVEQVLKMQIEIARGVLLVSTSWDEMKENARRRFEGMAQLKLLA